MSKPSDLPPVNPPGDDLRAPRSSVITNFNPESISIESIEHMGSNLDLDPRSLERGYRYRWVYRAPVKVSRAKARGYAVVDPASHQPIMNFAGDILQPVEDGTITVGDVVLMRTPEQHYRGRRKLLRKKTGEKLKGPTKSFKEKAKQEKQRNRRLSENIEVITNKDPDE